jgi:enoyl-CoA hydratase
LKGGNGFGTIAFEKAGAVAEITLDRPDALNVYNLQMRDDIHDVLDAVARDREIRVVILRGAGDRAFCAGADLSEFLTAPSPVLARRARFARDVWGRFLAVPQPLIAAMHGFVLGSGIEIALCCDIRIAAEGARFGLPELGLGIIPAAGGTQTLPRTTGRASALELLLSGRWIDAAEAHRVGLVTDVVPREQLLPAARATARRIAECSPGTVTAIKQAIARGFDLPLRDGLRLEKRLAARLAREDALATPR